MQTRKARLRKLDFSEVTRKVRGGLNTEPKPELEPSGHSTILTVITHLQAPKAMLFL